MTTEVDICKLALSHLGDEAGITAISPPDGSSQAAFCNSFYPVARDTMLEMHPWRCNTRRAVLAALSITPPVEWAFAYALPSDCVKPLKVMMPGTIPDIFALTTVNGAAIPLVSMVNSQDFIVESLSDGSAVLYTNVEQATLVYQVAITDVSKFTPLFVMALSRYLASLLAGPILKGDEGAKIGQAQMKAFNDFFLPMAKSSDANASQSHPYSTSTPAPILARQ